MFYLLLYGLLHVTAGLVTAGRLFRPPNRTEHIMLGGLVAYFTFFIFPLMTGWMTGYMNGYVIAVGGVAAIGAATSAFWFGDKADARLWSLRGVISRPWGEWLIWGTTGLLLMFLFLVGLALPARTYDAPAYHMSNPVRWHQSGKFILDSFGPVEFSPQLVSAECAPNVKAIWSFAVLLFTQNGAGTAAAQFPFLLLLIFAIRATALRLALPGWLASVCAAVTICIPEILLQSVETYADLVVLSGQALLIWSFLYLWQQPFGWRSGTYPAMAYAVLFGAKSTAVASGGALGLLYGVLLIIRAVKADRVRAFGWVSLALLLVITAVVVSGGPWLFHAWYKFANPLFPYTVNVGEKTLFAGKLPADINTGMLKNYTGAAGAEAYWNTLREKWRIPGLSNWSGGLGAFTFILGIPALLFFALGAFLKDKSAGSRRVYFVSFVLITAATPALAVARFSMFQAVVGIVAFAWVASVMPLVLRIAALTIAAAASLYSLYMTAPSIQLHRRPPALLAYHLLSGDSRAAQLDIYPDQYTALDFWREEVSKPGKKLAVHGFNVHVWNTYAPWSPADTLRVRDPRSPVDVDSWYAELRKEDITHFYVQRGQAAWNLVNNRPDRFRLLFKRADSHWGIMNAGFYLLPYPEDAIYELLGSGSNYGE